MPDSGPKPNPDPAAAPFLPRARVLDLRPRDADPAPIRAEPRVLGRANFFDLAAGTATPRPVKIQRNLSARAEIFWETEKIRAREFLAGVGAAGQAAARAAEAVGAGIGAIFDLAGDAVDRATTPVKFRRGKVPAEKISQKKSVKKLEKNPGSEARNPATEPPVAPRAAEISSAGAAKNPEKLDENVRPAESPAPTPALGARRGEIRFAAGSPAAEFFVKKVGEPATENPAAAKKSADPAGENLRAGDFSKNFATKNPEGDSADPEFFAKKSAEKNPVAEPGSRAPARFSLRRIAPAGARRPMILIGQLGVLAAVVLGASAAGQAMFSAEKALATFAETRAKIDPSALDAGGLGDLGDFLNEIEASLGPILALAATDSPASPLYETRELLAFADRAFAAAGQFAVVARELRTFDPAKMLGDGWWDFRPAFSAAEHAFTAGMREWRAARGHFTNLDRLAARPELAGIAEKMKTFAPLENLAEAAWPAARAFLGIDGRTRYLVLFENTGELRPGGGFRGSGAIFEARAGKISLEPFDVYDFDGQLRQAPPAPAAIAEITPTLGLRDSNFSPDFPRSAELAAELFHKGGGPAVDGVIAISSDILPRILALTGPVEADGKKFTAGNAWLRITGQNAINSHENRAAPKGEFLAFFEAVRDRLARGGISPAAAGRAFLDALDAGEVKVWSRQSPVENLAVRLGADGALGLDPAAPARLVGFSLSGNKSDHWVERAVTVEPAGDGKFVVRLAQRHGWDAATTGRVARELGVDPAVSPGIFETLGDGENRVWWRLYLPEGGRVLSATGAAIKPVALEEPGFFGVQFETRLQPGESGEVALEVEI